MNSEEIRNFLLNEPSQLPVISGENLFSISEEIDVQPQKEDMNNGIERFAKFTIEAIH